MKEHQQLHEEINKSIKDKVYGLPSKGWIDENLEEKKQRFDKIETMLIERISEVNDEMLMHIFIRWQEIRNQLNQMYVSEIQKYACITDSKINTNYNQ